MKGGCCLSTAHGRSSLGLVRFRSPGEDTNGGRVEGGDHGYLDSFRVVVHWFRLTLVLVPRYFILHMAQ